MTAALVLKDISKSYGEVPVLKGVNVEAAPGDFIVLLGPSGCGKSTLLHAIAGLHSINTGEIVIDGRNVNDVPTRERDIAMVFQSYALYPNMTVAENIGFPLKMRGIAPAERRKLVEKVAQGLQIEALLERTPRQLSGGQRQRVAIGRALVREPKIFLFDEPLSNLDATLRVEMRTEIKTLHRRIGKTIVYVTHDQIEAMTLATRIVVLNKGVIQQIGAPAEVYGRPANLFVARFIGTPAITLIEGRIGGQQFIADGGGLTLPVADLKDGRRVTMGLRPEFLHHNPESKTACRALVEIVEPTGPEDIVLLKLSGQRATAKWPTGLAKAGEERMIGVDPNGALFFDPESGKRIG
ncbi:MAG: ABC transporter ATP-binding protein [Pseudomonadota bacterium]